MKRVLKALAISFGGGLALGAGIRIGQASVKARPLPSQELDPLLDRLGDVEGRMARIETSVRDRAFAALSPTPGPSGPVQPQPAPAVPPAEFERLRREIRVVDHRVGEMESRLPGVIQSQVNARVADARQTLHREIEELHSSAVRALVETLQENVMERMAAFENSLRGQSESICELQRSSLRTDQNLHKMLAGIEQLRGPVRTPEPSADRSLEPARTPASGISSPPGPEGGAEPERPVAFGLVESQPSTRRWRTPVITGLLSVLILAGLVFASRLLRGRFVEAPVPVSATASAGTSSGAADSADVLALQERLSVSAGDPALLLELARQYARRKEWDRAEKAYRSILQTHPQDREAWLGLSDALYQQQKFEESAAALNRLSSARM